MNSKFIIIFILAIFIRLLSLIISILNERTLKLSGAVEYDKANSTLIMLSHTFFYIFCFVEGFKKNIGFDFITILGIAIYTFSTIILFIVINKLGEFWTFKLIISKKHYLIKDSLFNYFRHPNYFLNVIPELLAMTLIFKAWLTLIILFPVHMVLLFKRISQEDKIMKKIFDNY